MILLQVFNVPWLGESLSIYGFQVVASLSRVVDDSVGSFPCRAKLSLGWISSRSGNLAQDPYIKSSELYPLIVVFCHLQADTSSFGWKLILLLGPDGPGFAAKDCHYSFH